MMKGKLSPFRDQFSVFGGILIAIYLVVKN